MYRNSTSERVVKPKEEENKNRSPILHEKEENLHRIRKQCSEIHREKTAENSQFDRYREYEDQRQKKRRQNKVKQKTERECQTSTEKRKQAKIKENR